MLDLSARRVPTFYFIGVTTGQSSARAVWPDWMRVLDRSDVVFEGVDLPLHAESTAYRQVVEHIKHDRLSLGALVTTHKIDLLESARDLFDELGSDARTLNEVSSISKWDGKLVGDATDPIATRLTLDAMLEADYFGQSGGHLLCLGAGGAASAISLHFITRPDAGDRPQRFVVVDLLQSRLDKLRAMVERQQTDINFEYVLSRDVSINDRLMETLPDGSMVINATGLGKDRPGSPISNTARFPDSGIAWELNYRGELDFMHQALAQQTSRRQTSRRLRVEDGWIYFLHGWSQVINRVLHMEIEGEPFDRFAAAANAIRG